jgi:hypothetical protein
MLGNIMHKQALDIVCEQKPKAKSKFSIWSNKLLSSGIIMGTTALNASAESTAAEKRMGLGVLFGTFVVVGVVAVLQKINESRKNKKK